MFEFYMPSDILYPEVTIIWTSPGFDLRKHDVAMNVEVASYVDLLKSTETLILQERLLAMT